MLQDGLNRHTLNLFFFLRFTLEIIRYDAIVNDTSIVVGVAQLVERLTVAQNVAGSSPVSHPIFGITRTAGACKTP